jgi:hypothetical protein
MCNRYLIDPAVESILFLYSVFPAFDFLLLSSKLLFLIWKDILLQDSHTLNGNSILIYPIKCIWWLWFFLHFFPFSGTSWINGIVKNRTFADWAPAVHNFTASCAWPLMSLMSDRDLNNGHITVKSGKILQPSFSIWILW